MFIGNITSRRFENKISVLDEEIARFRSKLDRVKSWNRGLDDAEKNHVAGLEQALKQRELEKQNLNMSFVAKLEAVLGQVNGKARAWTVCADDLIGLAEECEEMMKSRGIRVKNRPGALVHYCPAGKTSRSQIGKNITTYIIMRRIHDGWRLVHAERDYCYVNQSEFREITVQPAAYEDMISHATQNFRVWEEKPADDPDA
ncbi:hypothetical protein [Sulfitobacter sp. CS16]|mgnify:CR=1 FL=1|uniref:hypothetical protein n=1 Tax=Sulfitobacter sp. CS16 TaxID=3368573 RepID=UPI0037477C55